MAFCRPGTGRVSSARKDGRGEYSHELAEAFLPDLTAVCKRVDYVVQVDVCLMFLLCMSLCYATSLLIYCDSEVVTTMMHDRFRLTKC
jgi:hypothetical protein